uniref:Uncharacterized protein n=1 Tax=Knipowitschia caucasica TaxID=637954 RepID=A0AAV2LLZ5_KNICA
MITDSCFHTSQNISGEMLPLAMVMLCDFQEHKFSPHFSSTENEQERHQDVKYLLNSLERCKTKLAASLARFRVKQSLRSVSSFLLDPIRTKQHQAKSLPLFTWVNTLMYSVEDVCEALQRASLCEVKSVAELKEMSFCRDRLCSDTLVFPKQLHVWLQTSTLTSSCIINIQERGLCVAVNVLRPLLFDSGDVLVAGCFSAVTVCHVAVAAAARAGRVLVCSADHAPSLIEEADPTKVETVQDVLARAAAKGLLGGILPEQSKLGKKGKGKKSQQAGSEQEAEGTGDAEDEELGDVEEGDRPDKSSNVGKKKKAGKGHKGKASTRQSKSHSKGDKKKVKKRIQGKRKPRRIPRLTLSLMSSAKASARLSLITPLVKKLKDNTAMITSSETSSGSSTPATQQPQSALSATRTEAEAAQKQLGKSEASEKGKESKVISVVQGQIDLGEVEVEDEDKPVDSVPLLESLFSNSSISITES